MTALYRLLALVPGLAPKLAGIVLVLLAITASYVLQAILIAHAVAAIMSGAALDAVAARLGLVLAVVGVRAFLLAHRGRVALAATGEVVRVLRQALAGQLFELGPAWARAQRSGALSSRWVDGVEAVEPFVARFVPQCVVTLLAAAGIGAYVLSLDRGVGTVVLVCSLGAPLVPIVSWRFIRERTERWQVHYRALYADNLDAIQGMATLKVLDASQRRGQELAAQAREFCRVSTRVIAIWGPHLALVALLVAAGSALAVGLGALQRAAGRLSSEELMALLLLSREAFRPVKDLESAYHDSWLFRSSAADLFALLDAAPAVRGGSESRLPSLAVGAALSFENVTFGYETSARPALERFQLTLAAGERVALVGRSGAGKSTVVSLLLRFFDPQHGHIRIGGRDLRELSLPTLRRSIALVSQDTYLFHGSVRENLLIARPEATPAELETAARAAQAHPFIMALPGGYEARVGERGLGLSGGERQRIAIARALLKDAPILVLDEATSAVDAANEAGIERAVELLSRGRVTLVIAHRLSTVRHLDRVVLIDQGRIIEQGQHDALLGERGPYARLAAAQGLLAPALAGAGGST